MSLAQRGRDDYGVAEMRKHFASYTPVYWEEARRFSPAFYAEFARLRFSRFPYFLGKYHFPAFEQEAQALHRRHNFDLILCDFLHSATPFVGSSLRPRALFQHNLEYRIRRQHWEKETNILRKWVLKDEWQKAFATERQVCKDFDHVITVSPEDTRDHCRDFAIQQVSDVPTGVDTDYFQPVAGAQIPGRIVFVGSFDWYPNEDGILWFLHEIYPRIRAAHPGVTTKIVGRLPTSNMNKAAAAYPELEITGAVPDVRPYLAQAEVVVVPLRMGGGTRIKIFEAMSMDRAVVSTPIGAEGLPLVAGREILLEESPEEFAKSVVRLLNHAGERNALAQAGREKVIRDHTWAAVAARMEGILRTVAGTQHTAAATSESRLQPTLAE